MLDAIVHGSLAVYCVVTLWMLILTGFAVFKIRRRGDSARTGAIWLRACAVVTCVYSITTVCHYSVETVLGEQVIAQDPTTNTTLQASIHLHTCEVLFRFICLAFAGVLTNELFLGSYLVMRGHRFRFHNTVRYIGLFVVFLCAIVALALFGLRMYNFHNVIEKQSLDAIRNSVFALDMVLCAYVILSLPFALMTLWKIRRSPNGHRMKKVSAFLVVIAVLGIIRHVFIIIYGTVWVIQGPVDVTYNFPPAAYLCYAIFVGASLAASQTTAFFLLRIQHHGLWSVRNEDWKGAALPANRAVCF